MNSTTNDKKKGKTWLPVLILSVAAVSAGVFVSSQIDVPSGASGRYNEQDASQNASQNASKNATQNASKAQQQQEHYNDDAFNALQAKLLNSTLLPDGFKTVPTFSLLQGENEPLTDAALRGKWSVMFFGFTNCPDICPVTLNEMNGVVAQLANENETVPQVMFITVDPIRDPIEKMVEYVDYFNEDFIAGSGELADITSLTRELGIVASYTANADGSDNYSVDHSASMLLIDPNLRVRAKLNPPHTIETIAADIKTLTTHYN